MDLTSNIRILTAKLVVLGFVCLALLGAHRALSGGLSMPETPQSPANKYFTDVMLVTHKGESLQLYTDLIKDKVVIIHSFFTSCKSSCPVSMRQMAGIQQRFSDNMGKELFILSISLDPAIDSPLKLQAYADELNAGPGWQLMSGSQGNVDLVLKKLGLYVADIESHKNTMIIGNESTGLWKKAFLLAPPEALDELISIVLNDEAPVAVLD